MWTLIYDGDCEFCQRQVKLVERWDKQGRVDAVPFQHAPLERLGVTQEAAADAMHLVAPSGAVWHGAAATRELMRLLPRTRLLAWIFLLPGVMPLAELVYRWVARRRHRFGCSSDNCHRGGVGA
jgi:predicted DCC family thiol-disulfide oxidoreductase YuxK